MKKVIFVIITCISLVFSYGCYNYAHLISQKYGINSSSEYGLICIYQANNQMPFSLWLPSGANCPFQVKTDMNGNFCNE